MLISQMPTFNKWKLLAAMQSITIYLLIRLDEGEREYNNVDSLLVSTIAVSECLLHVMRAYANLDQMLAQQLNSIGPETNEVLTSGHDTDKNWKQWIWEESARRCEINASSLQDP